MMAGLARAVLTHRKLIFSLWIALTLLGAFAANQVSKRWLEQFSIPGYSAYETNQRTLKIFGSGEQPPHIALLSVKKGDVTRTPGVKQAFATVVAEFPDFRTSSYFTTGSDIYVSKDRRTGRPL
jgi:predicted RND superfamily exporter protein